MSKLRHAAMRWRILAAIGLAVAALAGAPRPAAAAPASTTPAAGAPSPASLRGPIGLGDWRDLNQLPVNPVGVQTRMFSSFDRTGANDDGFSGKYSCLRQDSQGCVIADDQGAGEIDMMWFTRDGGPETRTGNITVILDGKTVISAPLTDVVDGKLGAPFVYPLVASYTQNSGGNYIYVPMTYAKSMEIITQNNPGFYQISYRHFASADGVTTFSPSADNASDVVRTLSAAGTKDPKPALPGAATQNVPFQLAPGQQTTLTNLSGPGEISAFRLNIPSLLGMTQPPQEVSDDGRGFGANGSSQFTMAINPSNSGVRLTRRFDGNAANQAADLYVDGQYAGQWAPEPEQWGLFVTENLDIPASLTRGKSQITIKNTAVSSSSNFDEYYYWAYSNVSGQWQQTDSLDVGTGHASDEQAHGYVITNQNFHGNTTREFLPATDEPAAVAATDDIMENARLEISFDGQQTVDVPLGQFFGSGLGKWQIRSLFDGVDGGQGGWLSSWWPMPYASSAVITLVNASQTPIQAGMAQITSAQDPAWAQQLSPNGHAGYFHATYHYGRTTQGRDVNWLTTSGTGKLAGVFTTMEGTDSTQGRGFMEGDQHVYMDGSKTPQINGTGTEDIAMGGWYFNQGMFTGAVSGDPWQQGAQYGCLANCTGEYRLWIPDAETFSSGITAGQEHGPTDNVSADYGTTAFWYGRPQVTGVQTDSLTVGDAASEAAHGYSSATACTPESLTSTYEGDDGPYEGLSPVNVTADAAQLSTPVSFTVKTDPDNQGVALERTSDQNFGYQAVEVYVNGTDAGQWQQPRANPYHRWLDDSFEIPASLTFGQPQLNIKLVHVPGSFAWSAASYRAVSLIGAQSVSTATAAASAQPTASAGSAATSSCSPAISSVSPSTVSAGQQVTITGSGFGATQGGGFVDFSDSGNSWGGPASWWWLGGGSGTPAPLALDSWSDTQITFTVPARGGQPQVMPGTPASVSVASSSGALSGSASMEIAPTSSMSDYYNDVGIVNDSSPLSSGGFDGSGSSYSAQALTAAGLTPGATVAHDGLTFTWPNVPAGLPDNVITGGQTILASGSGTTLGFLGAAAGGSASGTGTITYTDGSTQQFTLAMSDWWSNAAPPGGDILASFPYIVFPSGPGTQKVSIYYDPVSLQAGKTVQSITLPNVSNMHIFAAAIG